MNRVDFMRQLESLLQNIAPTEREEALQYYNDYFDDAGKENEQEVIEALGNPARVAENIKRDLLGSSAEMRKAQASDRALVEYGKGEQENQADAGSRADVGNQPDVGRWTDAGNQPDAGIRSDIGSTSGFGSGYGQSGTYLQSAKSTTQTGEKTGLPTWVIVLLVILAVFIVPMGAGILGVLVGVVVTWFALILSFGIISLAMFIALAVLLATGITCLFVNPWVGISLIGGGLICGAIGLLFLMLTVALAGIVTPALYKGTVSLFRKLKRG